MMMKVSLFMIVFKNYSRLGACIHTANNPEGDTPRDLRVGNCCLGVLPGRTGVGPGINSR